MNFLASIHLIIRLLVIVLAITLSVIDYYSMRLPYKLSLLLLGLGFVNSALNGASSFIVSLLAALVVGGCFLLVFLADPNKIGMGDVCFMAALASYLNVTFLIVLFLASVEGFIVGGILAIKERTCFKRQIPFGPFLTFGTLIVLLGGDKLLANYVPFLTPNFVGFCLHLSMSNIAPF